MLSSTNFGKLGPADVSVSVTFVFLIVRPPSSMALSVVQSTRVPPSIFMEVPAVIFISVADVTLIPPPSAVKAIAPAAVPVVFLISIVSLAISALALSLIYASASLLDSCSVCSSATFAVIPPADAVKAIASAPVPADVIINEALTSPTCSIVKSSSSASDVCDNIPAVPVLRITFFAGSVVVSVTSPVAAVSAIPDAPVTLTARLDPSIVTPVPPSISIPPAVAVKAIAPAAVPVVFLISIVSLAISALALSLIYASASLLDSCSVCSSATFAVIPPADAVKAIASAPVPADVIINEALTSPTCSIVKSSSSASDVCDNIPAVPVLRITFFAGSVVVSVTSPVAAVSAIPNTPSASTATLVSASIFNVGATRSRIFTSELWI